MCCRREDLSDNEVDELGEAQELRPACVSGHCDLPRLLPDELERESSWEEVDDLVHCEGDLPEEEAPGKLPDEAYADSEPEKGPDSEQHHPCPEESSPLPEQPKQESACTAQAGPVANEALPEESLPLLPREQAPEEAAPQPAAAPAAQAALPVALSAPGMEQLAPDWPVLTQAPARQALQQLLWLLLGQGTPHPGLPPDVLSRENGWQKLTQEQLLACFCAWRSVWAVPAGPCWLLSLLTSKLTALMLADSQHTRQPQALQGLLELAGQPAKSPASAPEGLAEDDAALAQLEQRQATRVVNWLAFLLATVPRAGQAAVCETLHEHLQGRLQRAWPFCQSGQRFDLTGWVQSVCEQAVQQRQAQPNADAVRPDADRLASWILSGTHAQVVHFPS